MSTLSAIIIGNFTLDQYIIKIRNMSILIGYKSVNLCYGSVVFIFFRQIKVLNAFCRLWLGVFVTCRSFIPSFKFLGKTLPHIVPCFIKCIPSGSMSFNKIFFIEADGKFI